MDNRTQIRMGELLALAALLAAGLLVVGSAIPGAQAQATADNESLLNTDMVVEDTSPGDTVTVDVEFNSTDAGTVQLVYNSTQTLNFTDNGTTESLSITAGEVHDSATIEATAEDLNGSTTYWDSADLNVSFESVNGTLENPETLDMRVSLSGVGAENVTETSVSGPGSSGLFSSVGGDSTTQTLIIFGAIIAGLWYARKNEVI